MRAGERVTIAQTERPPARLRLLLQAEFDGYAGGMLEAEG